jgi:hypothetical protein
MYKLKLRWGSTCKGEQKMFQDVQNSIEGGYRKWMTMWRIGVEKSASIVKHLEEYLYENTVSGLSTIVGESPEKLPWKLGLLWRQQEKSRACWADALCRRRYWINPREIPTTGNLTVKRHFVVYPSITQFILSAGVRKTPENGVSSLNRMFVIVSRVSQYVVMI